MLRLLGVIALLWFVTIWAFVAVMHGKALVERGALTRFWSFHVWPLAIVALLLDVTFNLTFGWVMFGELPLARGHWLFSERVQYHYRRSISWRGRLAEFWARQLNAVDPGHIGP